MKFEVKTQDNDFSKSFIAIFLTFSIIGVLIILTNLSIKFGKISKNYEINYLCRLLLIEKSSLTFKKLSKLTNQTTKQKIWDFCREFVE